MCFLFLKLKLQLIVIYLVFNSSKYSRKGHDVSLRLFGVQPIAKNQRIRSSV